MAYSEFKASFQEMARPNRFEITEAGLLSQPLLVKAASLPGSNIPPVEVFHEGLAVKLAGDRSYEDWDVTAYLNKEATLFANIIQWRDLAVNTANVGSTNKEDYKFDLGVRMLNRDGSTIDGTEFKLIGAFPSVVAPIDLDHSTNDTAGEFTITFSYDYYENI